MEFTDIVKNILFFVFIMTSFSALYILCNTAYEKQKSDLYRTIKESEISRSLKQEIKTLSAYVLEKLSVNYPDTDEYLKRVAYIQGKISTVSESSSIEEDLEVLSALIKYVSLIKAHRVNPTK